MGKYNSQIALTIDNASSKARSKPKKAPRKGGFSFDELEGVAIPDRLSRRSQKQSWRNMVDLALMEDDED